MSILASNIKYLRKQSGLSQTDFGKIFNASRGMVDTYEGGRAQPTHDTVKKIATHFKVSLDDITARDLSKGYSLRVVEAETDEVKDELIKVLQKQVENLQGTVEQQQAIIEKLLHNNHNK